MKKRKKQLRFWFIVATVGIALFLYLRPVAIDYTTRGIVYSFEDDFEKETTIVLTGTLHKDPFQGNVLLGDVVVDGDIAYPVRLKDSGTHYFHAIAVETSDSFLRTIGTVYASNDLKQLWLKLDAIDARYGIDGYSFGPAENKEEANELVSRMLQP